MSDPNFYTKEQARWSAYGIRIGLVLVFAECWWLAC